MKFHHVGISVADLDRSKKWYADVLGFTAGYSFALPPVSLCGCFMERDGVQVELIERAGSVRAPSTGGISGPDPNAALLTHGYGHLAFTVNDLDATFERLVTAGAAAVWEPRPSPQPGVRMAFVADVDGNLIEIMETVQGKTT
jgi:catechol 2,3-dioxygenase-like lactoylglutathione lyase family enzyme